jgi:short-subunit dehydrogenase
MKRGIMEDLFRGRWVLITGASSGLGEEFARQLAATRANLVLTARSGEKLQALAKSLAAQHGIETRVLALDLSAEGGAPKLCAEVDRLGLPIEHLISNAGFGLVGPIGASAGARLAEMVRLNCEALTVLSQHFVGPMAQRRSGGIIHLGSVAGFQPLPYMATYGASKAFVVSFSVALAEEVRGSGVRVLALCPGPVPTGFQKVAGSGIARQQRRAVMSAEDTVRAGLAAYAEGRDLYVPGRINRAGAVSAKLLPRRTLVRAVGHMMKERYES